ncbi:unnamed protein product [Chondrus crispus]|uniref:Uncharacterized protein n=1 Tax=Chondrus crispus TaxID=2769 RepID=R7QEM4_CHOCR|nr:unnamed protein product [Chondrus crispus]CDF36957.1 unnamed protein product [Chondrus crispus]|eukprot:XP_005716776.1 unnamed protein product [Chondrus crispus]
MAYPYPPSPYTPGSWSREQDENYFANLQLPPTRPLISYVYTGHTSTNNILTGILPEQTRFYAWSDFHRKVRTARRDSKNTIASLSGTESAAVGGMFDGAKWQLTRNYIITTEADTSSIVLNASSSVARVYGKLDHNQILISCGHYATMPSDVFRYGGAPQIDLVFRRSLGTVASGSHHRNQEPVILVAGEVKRPSMPLTHILVSGNTAEHVAAAHNDGYKAGGKTWYVRMMSQALTYAMHTKNGCVFLTNHNQAMFMKVGAQSGRRGWKMMVKVSRLYKCNADESSFHGIIAILRESDLGSDGRGELRAAYNYFQQTLLEESPRESSRRDETNRNAPKAKKRTTGRGSRANRAASGRSGTTVANMVASIQEENGIAKIKNSPFFLRCASTLYQPEVIERLMGASDDIIRMAKNLTVSRGFNDVADMAVAAKYWNGARKHRQQMVSKEAELYKEVAERCPNLFWAVLMGQVTLWKEPATESAVIAEHWGESLRIERNRNGFNAVLECGHIA